jgi:AcrR family transcriptional regulator
VAAAAGVSPGLVVHHYGSLDGLRAAVDTYVLDLLNAVLAEALADAGPDLYDAAATASIAAALIRHLPPDSPVPAYLRRLLLSDTDAARRLFERLYRLAGAALDSMVAAGLAAPGADPAVRVAVLLVNDLALLLLRERIADVLGLDPYSPEGMRRWAGEVLAIYGTGLRSPQQVGDPPARAVNERTGPGSGTGNP